MKINNFRKLKTRLIDTSKTILFFLLAAFFMVCKKKEDTHFPNEIVDYSYKTQINPLIKAADALRYNQDYLKAKNEYENLWHTQTLTPIEKAYTLNQLAFTCLMTNRDSLAKKWIDTLDTYSRTQNFQEQDIEADINFNKGILYNLIIKPYQARPFLEKALASYRILYGNRHLKVAMCLNLMGLGLLEYERFTDTGTIAFYNIRLANDIFQSNQQLLPYSAENDLAMGCIALLQRDHVQGQSYPERALGILNKLPYTDTILKARIIGLKANLVKKTNQLEKAEALFLNAIALAEPTNHPRLQEFYRDLIINHVHKKDEKAFWQTLGQLETIVKKQGVDYFAFPERLKGFFYDYNNNYREALDYYLFFWGKYKKDATFNYCLMDETLYILTSVYNKIHKPDSALFFHHKELFYKTSFASKAFNIEDYFLPNNYRRFYNPSSFISDVANTLFEKYCVTKNNFILKQSLKTYILADSLLFPGIKSSNEDIVLTFQNELGDNFYPKALQAAWLLHQQYKTNPQTHLHRDIPLIDNALRFTERMKAYLLYRDNNQLPDSLRKLLTEINFLKWRNNQGWQDKGLADKIIKTQNKYETGMLQLKQYSNGFLINNIVQPIPTITQIQDTLSPDEAIIEYSLAGNKIHILYINKTKTLFHQADTAQLEALINQYLVDVKDTKCAATNYGTTAYKLYQALLAPLEPELFKTKKLLIVPDRILHLVPFEALVTTPKFNSFHDTSFFLNKFEAISYSPSWKMYQKNRINNHLGKGNKHILCFTYGDSEGEGALKDSQREIEAIEKAFGKSQVETNMYANCTKKRFLEKITRSQSYDIIHLSLHAKSNPKNRQDNNIWFKIKPLGDTLFGFEVQNLVLHTSLVVLSACETALGDTKTGEGVYALSRSFLQAGSANVVATLWSVSNNTNSELMSRFYTNLSQDKNVNTSFSQSMCSSKRQYIVNVEDKSLAHPYYWAGIIALN
jgi:CHAT domain-containing protein